MSVAEQYYFLQWQICFMSWLEQQKYYFMLNLQFCNFILFLFCIVHVISAVLFEENLSII